MKTPNLARGLCLSSLAIGCLLLGGCSVPAELSIDLKGAGASFPAPLYQRWFSEYTQTCPAIKVSYQSVGSGRGIQSFQAEEVDFGASDVPMTAEEVAQVPRGVTQIPMAAGAIALAYNLEGGPVELKLSREAYVGIFLGRVSHWNDPIIAKSNEGAQLPDAPIFVVVRGDSSGTTYAFTDHLSTISEDFANGPGIGKTVNWDNGQLYVVHADKNDGVSAAIKETPGSIGYVEFGFAEEARLPVAALENAAGRFARPTAAHLQLLRPDPTENHDYPMLPDPNSKHAYPIVAYTWLLVYNSYSDSKKSQSLLSLVKYCLTEGQKVSHEMGYIPLPSMVVKDALASAESSMGRKSRAKANPPAEATSEPEGPAANALEQAQAGVSP